MKGKEKLKAERNHQSNDSCNPKCRCQDISGMMEKYCSNESTFNWNMMMQNMCGNTSKEEQQN